MPETELEVLDETLDRAEEDEADSEFGYEDIGGCDKQLAKIRELVERGLINTMRVDTEENVSDIFTKPLGYRRFEKLRKPGATKGAVARCVEPCAMLSHLDGNEGSSDKIDVRPTVFRRNIKSIESHGFGFLYQSRLVLRRELIPIWVEIEFKG